MAQVVVSGILRTPDGLPVGGATVQARLLSYDVQAGTGDVYAGDTVISTSDATGGWALNLWANSDGVATSRYEFTFSRVGYPDQSYTVDIPDSPGTVSFADVVAAARVYSVQKDNIVQLVADTNAAKNAATAAANTSAAANWRGGWLAGSAYAVNDIVTSANKMWRASAASTGVTPVEGASWMLLVDGGVAGSGADWNTLANKPASFTPSAHVHADATTSAAGFMSTADKTKLDGIAAGATANSSNATLLDRANHTGVQAIATITNLSTELAAKPGKAENATISGNWIHDGTLGTTRGGRLMETSGAPARYLSNNPNRVQNPSGELALTGWTTTGTPTVFDEAEGGLCFRATAAFEMYTDVKVWRANKNEYVSVLPAFQSEGTEIQVELLDAAKVLLATLTAWTNITAAGIVLGYAGAAGWVATNADGFLRVRFRSIAAPLADTRFRNVSVTYGLPVIGGGYPVHLLRYLFDRPSGGGGGAQLFAPLLSTGATSYTGGAVPDATLYKIELLVSGGGIVNPTRSGPVQQWSHSGTTLTFDDTGLAPTSGEEIGIYYRSLA